MANSKVHLLARKIDVVQRGGDAQIDPRMRLGKMAEPVHQPFGGEVRRGGYREHAGVLSLQEPLGAHGDAVKRVADNREIVTSGLGDDQALALAIKKFYCELCLQRLDLVAHRALRDAKLFRRAGKALMPRGRLKDSQSIQRREAWAHCT